MANRMKLPDRMKLRRPNQRASRAADEIKHRYEIPGHFADYLHWNQPSKSGKPPGGYQQFENRLIDRMKTHPETTRQLRILTLSATELARLQRYVDTTYGSGGPNDRLRRAFGWLFPKRPPAAKATMSRGKPAGP